MLAFALYLQAQEELASQESSTLLLELCFLFPCCTAARLLSLEGPQCELLCISVVISEILLPIVFSWMSKTS